MRAVILAGGKGTRLAPYTTVLPKPLMPIGDYPVLEVLIRRLVQFGITRVTIAIGHLASLIQAYFGDGSKFGVQIDYSMEEQPLGTAGPLSLIPDLDDRFLVMNGDLLTDLDFRQMVRTHEESGAVTTVGLYQREVKIDFGVIELKAARISGYIEKPTYQYDVSMGVYVFERRALASIPHNTRFDLPDLIQALVRSGEVVVGHHHRGYWLDIGRPDDYARAQDDFEQRRAQFLGF